MYYEMLGKKNDAFLDFFFLQRMKICATSCLKFQGKQVTTPGNCTDCSNRILEEKRGKKIESHWQRQQGRCKSKYSSSKTRANQHSTARWKTESEFIPVPLFDSLCAWDLRWQEAVAASLNNLLFTLPSWQLLFFLSSRLHLLQQAAFLLLSYHSWPSNTLETLASTPIGPPSLRLRDLMRRPLVAYLRSFFCRRTTTEKEERAAEGENRLRINKTQTP